VIYDFSLSTVGWCLGLLYILTHGAALLWPEPVEHFLRGFHRNETVGRGVFVLAAAWAGWCLWHMELMEYTPYRGLFLLFVVVLAIAALILLPAYIGVRGLGIHLLLGANVLLDAAFLRDEPSRLLLVVLAYAYIVAGMFLAGMPYLFRDAVDWCYASPVRARAAWSAGLIFGLVLIGFGWLAW
jgi:hypothetical protein